MPMIAMLSALSRALTRALPGVALATSLLLRGCTPEHDGREIRASDDGFVAMMPSRPARMTQPVDLDGLRLPMSMQGSLVRDVAYTVGTASLPTDAGKAATEQALAVMRRAMVRNIDGQERKTRPVRFSLIDGSGAVLGSVDGIEVEAVGRMRGQEATLIARFASVDTRVWQVVVLGPVPDREQADMFLDSVRLIRR
jgi:hypothetical protein